jgi:hypothetical protein
MIMKLAIERNWIGFKNISGQTPRCWNANFIPN